MHDTRAMNANPPMEAAAYRPGGLAYLGLFLEGVRQLGYGKGPSIVIERRY
jgi:hypothetical protein